MEVAYNIQGQNWSENVLDVSVESWQKNGILSQNIIS